MNKPVTTRSTTSQRKRLHWHPARLLYVFIVTLILCIIFSGIQAILTDGPNAVLDLHKLSRTFIGQLAAKYPLIFWPWVAICLIIVGRGWYLHRLHLREQAKEQIKDVIHNEMGISWPELHVHIPTSVSQQTIPFLAPPLPPYDLIGRDDLLQQLKQHLFTGGSLALFALNGKPGVGKTALAIALAHDEEVRDRFPGGVLWARLGLQPNLLARLGEWGVALGIPQTEIDKLTDLEARVQAVYTAIGSRQMLLVADDAWQVETAQAFMLGGSNCAYLVTTRLPKVASLVATGEGVIEVPELREDDGLILLSRLAPRAVEAEPDKARELVQAVGGLPLALTLIGNYLRMQTHSKQTRRLAACRRERSRGLASCYASSHVIHGTSRGRERNTITCRTASMMMR